MNVRAKFKVTSIQHFENDQARICLGSASSHSQP